VKAYSFVVDFARLGIQFSQAKSHESAVLRTELYSRMFNAAIVMSRFDLAQTALIKMEDEHLQHAALRKLVERMSETYHNIELASLPLPGLVEDVDRILEEKCKTSLDVVHGNPYHQILYAWRIKHQKHQAAALVLYDRIQKLRYAGEGDKFTGEYVLDSAVTREYLLCINALAVLPKKERWILPDEFPPTKPGDADARNGDDMSFSKDLLQAVTVEGDSLLPFPDLTRGSDDHEPRRRLVTLDDIRREYQDELKRITAIQNNQFGFEADDMDIL
jgi:nuclear pore complex protein Nup160